MIFISAGCRELTDEVVNFELSSGGLVWSGNARPIPQVRAGFIDFVDIPFTKVRQHCARSCQRRRESLYNKSMELIVPELAKQYGVTEQLKAENQMEWVRQMNACKAQTEEVVKTELIYD